MVPGSAIGTVYREDSAGRGFLDPGNPSIIRIDPRWEAGLAGIEEFSHLVVLFYADRAERRRVARRANASRGSRRRLPRGCFFATRTPKRPNPIGIACPRLIGREGSELRVAGLDAWDGTPVLDIKGYYPRDEQRPDAAVPEWLTTLWRQHDAERAPNPRFLWARPCHYPAQSLPGTRRQRARSIPVSAADRCFVGAQVRQRPIGRADFVLFQGEQMTLAQERGLDR